MKKYLCLIVALLLFCMTFGVSAESNEMLNATTLLSCSANKLAPGESTTCAVSVKVSGGGLVGFQTTPTVGDGLSLSNYKTASDWQGSGEDGKYVLYAEDGKEGNVAIGSFTVTANSGLASTSSVSLTNIVMAGVAGDTDKIRPGIVSVSIGAKSTNSSLTSLSVSSVSLSPSFSPATTSYTATVDASSINISATAEGKISGVGAKTLNYGENKFQIVVTAEAGNTTTYTIIINRPDNRSNVNTLKSLKLSEGEIDFSSSKTSYNISVSSKTDSIKITSSLTDSKSRYIAGSSAMNVKLDYGVNTVKITVQAENGSNKTYTIKITRRDDRSKDNTLKEIKLATGDIEIDKEKDEYEIKVSYDEEVFDFAAIASDDNAKVEIIGDKNLKVGENLFEIKVTAENGDIKTYKLKVIRQEEDVVLSSDSSLKSLVISDHEIDFEKDNKAYKVKTKEDKLEIEAIPSDKKAEVEIKNNSELEDGSVISIIVTAEDGTSTKYEIIIEKDKGLLIPIVGIVVILLVIGILVFFILKKKKISKEKL